MSKTAPVSTVVPCFCCGKTIERAVASVAAQTVLPAELVLVDDASGDGTRSLLLEIAARFPVGWVKLVLLDKNVGVASARNAGWAVASQPFVAFLDSDDAWHPQKIEIQFDYMQAHPEVALCGHAFRLLKNATLPDWSIGENLPSVVGKWEMMLKNQIVTPSVMVRRDIPHRFLAHQRHMEDHMLWMCVVCDGLGVARLKSELAAIYKRPFGVTGLSSQVWLMARSDVSNYLRLFQRRSVSLFEFLLLMLFSIVKLVRRLLIYFTYVRWTKWI
jgi:glycosyltransferase involved in cell wall biosynthesis